MTDFDLIYTGIKGLDDILLGGIKRGNILLVEGAAGTGKTTLGLAFIYRGVMDFDEPGLIISFELSPQKLLRDAKGFGWDFEALEQKGVRVLVVDDSPDTLAVLKTMIESAGYQVETASSAQSAVRVAASFKPDIIIISDLGMPDTDGFELLRTLREDSGLTDTPVIALTGYATQVDREATLHAGFAAHLAKPIEQSALVSTLDQLLEKAKVKR